MLNRKRHGAAVAALAVTLSTFGAAASGSAAPPEPCTRGSAQKVIQAGIVAANHMRQGRTTGLVEADLHCSYLVYDDGATYTFSEDDTFTGATAFTWWDWEADGLTRQEVRGILSRTEYRVLLAEVSPDGSVGAFVEQPIVRTPVKQHVMEGQGQTIHQLAGVILHLDEGTYISQFHWSSPDFPDENLIAEVTLVVTD